ncbi:hypothetical protein ACXHMN_17025 [Rhizobium sp. LEGMi12c]
MYRNVDVPGFDTLRYKLADLGAISLVVQLLADAVGEKGPDCIRLYLCGLKLHRYSKGGRLRHIGDTCGWLS